MEFNEENLSSFIKKLNVKNGDTLVIDPGLTEPVNMDKLTKFVNSLADTYLKMQNKDVIIVITPPGGDIKKLTKDQIEKILEHSNNKE